MNGGDRDLAIRLATFDWLKEQTVAFGDVLPRELLPKGFEFQGERVPLVAPQGIFKPRIMDLPLSITTPTADPFSPIIQNNFQTTRLQRSKENI